MLSDEQIDISVSCLCPVIDHEFHHNLVKIAMNPQGDRQMHSQTTLEML